MHLTWFCLFHIIICTWKSSFLNLKNCGADSSQARAAVLHSDWKLSCEFFLQLSYNDNKYLSWHWPHYEDGEPDKYEEGATDADHRECPKVDLTIACWTKTLSLQRLKSTSSLDWEYYNPHLGSSEHGSLAQEVGRPAPSPRLKDGTDFLSSKMSLRMSQLFVLRYVTVFSLKDATAFCPQEGFGMRLRHSIKFKGEVQSICPHRGVSFPYRLLGFHITWFLHWLRAVTTQFGNQKNTLNSLQQISAPNKSIWHNHCQRWITALSKELLLPPEHKNENWEVESLNFRPRPSSWTWEISPVCVLLITCSKDVLFLVSLESLDAQVPKLWGWEPDLPVDLRISAAAAASPRVPHQPSPASPAASDWEVGIKIQKPPTRNHHVETTISTITSTNTKNEVSFSHLWEYHEYQ